MRKILSTLAIVAAMLVALPSQAQVKFGVRGGLNLTNMKLSTAVFDKSNHAGFYIGPTVKVSLPITGLSFDLSAVYDQRAVSVQENVYDLNNQVCGTISNSVTSKAIAIPVNVRYGVGLGSLLNVFAFAGPQFSFNVGGDSFADAVSSWTWKGSNVSINLGVGFTVMKHVEIKANYNFACGTAAEFKVPNPITGNEDITEAKYNAWQAGVCYYF